jgi:Ser/Thr protein kinase RdoA (MazF antagonist)
MDSSPPPPSRCAPTLHSLIAGDTLRQLVHDDFGLQAAGDVRLIQSGLNDHYALYSPHGDFVIRVYRSGWRSDEAITWELDLVDHLASCGAPVAACLRRRDGAWFSQILAIEGMRQVALFRHAPGQYTHFGATGVHRISPADCAEQFGRSVAEVHAAADRYVARAARFQLDLTHLLDQPLDAIARAYAHREPDLEQLRSLAGELRQMLQIDRRADLDWGPCHGDMSSGNSTYWNGRVIHFDFDCGGPGWRAYDLGVFYWSMRNNGHEREVWERFLHGYSAHRPASGADLSLVPAFAAIRVIWLMGLWCANAQLFGYHKLHDDYFDRELAHVQRFYQEALRSINAS